jgi:hypothetical protein
MSSEVELRCRYGIVKCHAVYIFFPKSNRKAQTAIVGCLVVIKNLTVISVDGYNWSSREPRAYPRASPDNRSAKQ